MEKAPGALGHRADTKEDPVNTETALDDMDVATYFSLSYSNFLVLHRVELEHMPTEWQHRLVAMLNELDGAYRHLDHPQGYEVHPCRYVEVWELDDDERKAVGVTSSLDDFPALPDDATEGQREAHDRAYEEACEAELFYDADGTELEKWQRVPIRVSDPIPHYRHGRVEPRLS
ncbi:hypothetical protein KGD82_13425 [Nocardiopsis eucommiae]|uniref:Uncharacterized protein n=1 Tax=Nocardiopsis eucommiae TaxID=2831970 RepID=A0A975LBW7_9ACTN|nr:hypothetical protein KGD82_13425 [Nocardiopsis eucommiae]